MERKNVWGLWAGLGLIALGALFLLGQFLQVNLARYLWPLFIMAAGGAFFLGMFSAGRSLGALAVPGSVLVTIGAILLVQNLFGLWATWTYAWALIIAGAGVGLTIFGRRSQIPELVQAGRVVTIVGLVLFFIFGLIFELGASLLGLRSPGGIVWAVLLILAGLYVVFGRRLFPAWTDAGPVGRTSVEFDRGAPGVDTAGAQVYGGWPETGEAVTTTGVRRVRFRAVGELIVVQGEREALEIEASQAVRERVRAEVRGDTLEIRLEQGWAEWLQPRFWNAGSSPRFRLMVRELESLEAAGIGEVVVPALRAGRFALHHSGTGAVKIGDFRGEALEVTQAGLGDIEIAGQVRAQRVTLSGTGSYRAAHLDSISANVKVSGLGSAVVWAREDLEARLSGTGSIEYYGSPRLAQTVSGLGSIHRVGDR